jgi:hypothetical protein
MYCKYVTHARTHTRSHTHVLIECMDGSTPSRVCKRLFTNDIDMLEHKTNGDTCGDNEYCATYGRYSVVCIQLLTHNIPVPVLVTVADYIVQ